MITKDSDTLHVIANAPVMFSWLPRQHQIPVALRKLFQSNACQKTAFLCGLHGLCERLSEKVTNHCPCFCFLVLRIGSDMTFSAASASCCWPQSHFSPVNHFAPLKRQVCAFRVDLAGLSRSSHIHGLCVMLSKAVGEVYALNKIVISHNASPTRDVFAA